MSVKDVIKHSVLEQFGAGAELSAGTILLLIMVSVLIGVYLFLIYKNQAKAAFYSRDINITIAGLPVIVCVIMIAMQSNLIVSLGMVGALSIVRFRNAVKNPLDLLYFFWSISAGIVCGVGLITLAVFLCAAMTGMVLLLNLIPASRSSSVLVLRTSVQDVDWTGVADVVASYGRQVQENARDRRSGYSEVIYELTVADEEQLINAIRKLEQVDQISLLSHDGEYRI